MNELSDAALAHQLEAFYSLRRRRSVTIYQWMDGKDFAEGDRLELLRIYLDSTDHN